MNKVRLPDKREIFCINAAEALLLYEDIYRDRSYLSRGITIRDGDCVFDVGANIGLFSMFANQEASGLQLYAFEPIPPVFDVLAANLSSHDVRAHLYSCGLSSQVSKAKFAFYDHNSAMSGMYWDVQEEKHVARAILLNKQPDLEGHIEDVLEAGFDPTFFECQLRTLSDVIAENGIHKIDLLKIDVEKSELDVLGGISEEHWPNIKQIVLEVHDIEERMHRVNEILECHGFETNIVQSGFYVGTGLYDVHASRRKAFAGF